MCRLPGQTLAKLAGVHELGAQADLAAVLLGVGTIALMVAWRRMPARLRIVPGALVGVAAATAAAALLRLPVEKVRVTGALAAVSPPAWGDFEVLASVGAAGTVVALALIASAETLFSAAAVDRMHDGPRTEYDKELIAQGVGNSVCGLLGALPMTAVIVRSAANVEAGARTRAARVMHGGWLLLFAVAFPGFWRACRWPRWPGCCCTRAGSCCRPGRWRRCGGRTGARRWCSW